MKTESLSLILLIISFRCQTLSAFFQSVFDLGPRTTECTAWSWWSPCFSTKDPSFWFRMPGYCDFNPYGRQLRNNGVLTAIESSYGYLKKLNDTKTPCGQCLYQISCSYRCRGFDNGLAATGIGPNEGVASQLCDDKKMDQSPACKVALEETGGACQMWPPPNARANTAAAQQLFSSQLTNCVNTDDGCYCCCMPYIPNPDTKICERLMDFVRKRGDSTSSPT